jgi:hypothetical protein
MKKETLLQKGFRERPHLILGSIFDLNVGRNRYITIGALGTPNEVIYITQKHDDGDITEMICIRNFDYDGLLTPKKLAAIISIFT